MFSGAGVCFLPFFAIGSSSLGSRGESKILLRKDTLGGGALRGARLFHLDRTSAERWRDANFPRLWSDDLKEDVLYCQSLVERHGMEMLVLDLTRPDVGLPVVKVVVPGLRPLWARLAPGRLYDVPVQQGYLPQPLPEAQLNPIPMFL